METSYKKKSVKNVFANDKGVCHFNETDHMAKFIFSSQKSMENSEERKECLPTYFSGCYIGHTLSEIKKSLHTNLPYERTESYGFQILLM